MGLSRGLEDNIWLFRCLEGKIMGHSGALSVNMGLSGALRVKYGAFRCFERKIWGLQGVLTLAGKSKQ